MALFQVTRKQEPKQLNEKAMELIKRRRLQLLVHSCIYYRLNDNIITDHTFDMWSVELVNLQKQYPAEAAKTCYADAFKDWDGSTGAFLPLTDPWVVNRAMSLLNNRGRFGV